MPYLQRVARACHEWHLGVTSDLASIIGRGYASSRRGDHEARMMSEHATEASGTAAGGETTPHPFRLSRRELVLVVAFWTFMAALSVGNRFLDPRQLGFQVTNASAPIVLAFVSSYLWALLTPFVFWLSARVLANRRHRILGMLALVVVGFAIASALGMTGESLRSALTPFTPRRGGRGGGGPP